jgi:hypothetical protein
MRAEVVLSAHGTASPASQRLQVRFIRTQVCWDENQQKTKSGSLERASERAFTWRYIHAWHARDIRRTTEVEAVLGMLDRVLEPRARLRLTMG